MIFTTSEASEGDDVRNLLEISTECNTFWISMYTICIISVKITY